MLDELDLPRELLTDAIAALPCAVQLPPAWHQQATGPSTFRSVPDDQRRFFRRAYRAEAALRYLPAFTALKRPGGACRVYTLDLSRGGLSFLHSEQVFPRERLAILFGNGHECVVEVRRCRRMTEGCFEVGSRFVGMTSSPSLSCPVTGDLANGGS